MNGNKKQSKEAINLTTITDEHIVSLDELCKRLGTNLVTGMKKSQVKKILKERGENKFKPPKKMFSLEFSGSKDRKEEHEKFSKSEWKRIFGQHLPSEVAVIRKGERYNIAAKNIVMGDLIDLDTNDIVPADIRLVWAKRLMVDNRIITGNHCQKRTHRMQEATEDPILSPNVIFACTRIISGHCLGVALRTGEDTVFGTLKNYAQKVKVRKKHSTSSCASNTSGDSSLDIQSITSPSSSCQSPSVDDINSTYSKNSSNPSVNDGSTSSLICSSSSEPDLTSEDGYTSGEYGRRSLASARSISGILQDCGTVDCDKDFHCYHPDLTIMSAPGRAYFYKPLNQCFGEFATRQ